MFDSTWSIKPHSHRAKVKKIQEITTNIKEIFRFGLVWMWIFATEVLLILFSPNRLAQIFDSQTEIVPLICQLQSPMYQNFPIYQMSHFHCLEFSQYLRKECHLKLEKLINFTIFDFWKKNRYPKCFGSK